MLSINAANVLFNFYLSKSEDKKSASARYFYPF